MPDEQAAEEQPNAVVVLREFAEDGGVQTKVVISGDIRITEVETILRLGLNGWQQQAGL